MVLAAGFALTGLFASASSDSYQHSEQTLTRLQTSLAASVLEESSADLRRRLEPALLLAAQGGPGSFAAQASPSVGKGGPFVGVQLFRLAPGVRMVASVGGPLKAPPPAPQAMGAIARAGTAGNLAVTHVVGAGYQRLGYALTARGAAGDFAIYAEQVLAANRRLSVGPSNPAANLYIAIYYGRRQDPGALIGTDAPHLPLGGIHTSVSFPFGAATLTLVASPKASLAGGFAASQTTIIAVGGTVITVLVAALVEVLIRRRRHAERQAAQSRRIAETLQRSLLPARLPETAGVRLAARYQPATAGVSVGGDWYDAAQVDGKLYFSVGDVAGHGLEAASLMGRLRTAIEAYMSDGGRPDEVLAKLSRLVDVGVDGHFATVVCGWMDPTTGELAYASAGHPEPVVIDGGRCQPLTGAVGAPVGVGTAYQVNTAVLPPGATLLAYTDGLVERRGETITSGITRLCQLAAVDLPLDRLLDHLLGQLVPTGGGDDVAILAMRRRA